MPTGECAACRPIPVMVRRFYGRREGGAAGIFPRTYVERVPDAPVVARAATHAAVFRYEAKLPPHPWRCARRRAVRWSKQRRYDVAMPTARLFWEPPSRAALQAAPTVFVFDLDETLIVFNKLLTGQYAAELGKVWRCAAGGSRSDAQDEAIGKAIGRYFEAAVLELADSQFFFNDLEDCAELSIAAALAADDGASLQAYKCGGAVFQVGFTLLSFALDGLRTAQGPLRQRKTAYRFRAIGDKYSLVRALAPLCGVTCGCRPTRPLPPARATRN